MNNKTKQQKKKEIFERTDPVLDRPFLANDFAWLSQNRYGRWRPNAPEVGHAVIHQAADGTEIAEQYTISHQNDLTENSINEQKSDIVPCVKHLMRIEAIQSPMNQEGDTVLCYRAVTEEGVPMIGSRANKIEISDMATGTVEKARVVYFSPERADHFYGSGKKMPIFKENLSLKQLTLKEALENAVKIKGLKNISISPEDVALRVNMDRQRGQKKTMGNRSASDEYRQVLQSEKATLLSPELLNKLTEAIEADLSILTESQKKPEWAHVYAFALMLVSENPQVPDNLVAAPRWFNTAMLVLESTAIWFSLNRPNALIHMQAIFETLLDTDILNKGAYQISIEEQSRCIRLFESYDLSLEHAMFRSPSDLAQLSAISYALLSNALPKSRYAVEGQTIQADLPVINAMTMVPLGINTIKTQTTAPKLVAQSSIEKQSEKPKMLLFSYMPGFSSFSTLLSVPRRLLTAIIRK